MENQSLLDFSDYLSANVKALFSLNPFKYSRDEIIPKFGNKTENLAIPEQVHSAVVEIAKLPGIYPAADGLVTTSSDILLTLKVADCVPVFLFDPRKRIIGLVHSGWKGTVENIVQNAIRLMQKNGAETEDIRCYLGPAIGTCCYEVDGEVARKFDDKAKVKINERKWKVGLHDQISLQLVEMGIPAQNIGVSNMCTYELPKCHSYRRDGENAGRMFAFLGLT
ncbi:MAG: peptidoglycan editing factor PgeF [Candidatus Marinimicrobia bacterium]|nr:peptidoglycan editing factor PgeF [Candidatus Neomarinimicrobiota bacterium]